MGFAVDSAGNLFIADATDACIREVNAVTGIITTVAGIGNSPGSSGDGGQATAAQFLWPNGIAVYWPATSSLATRETTAFAR